MARFDQTDLRIAIASFISACAWFYTFPTGGFGAGFEAPAIARSLVETGQFANPFSSPTGPTAHVAPLFPAFLALLILVFRTPFWIVIAAVTSAAMASTAVMVSVPRLSQIFVGRRQPGIYAAYMGILIPFSPLYPHWDANFTAAAVALFTIAAYRLSDGAYFHSLLLGLFAGLIALLNPVATIAAVCPFLVFSVRHRNAMRSLPVFAAALLLTISPWLYRNWVVFGRLIPVRGNLGMELSVYNEDRAPARAHPNTNAAEAAVLRDMGEAAYSRVGYVKAFTWIKAHPKEFASRTSSRMIDFWFPHLSGAYAPDHAAATRDVNYSIAAWLLPLLALPGLLLVERRLPFISVLALYPVVYYLTLASERYRIPIIWMLLVLAGISVDWLWQRLGRRLR